MADKEVINVRERPLSSDIMDMQAIGSRVLEDAMKWLHTSQFREALHSSFWEENPGPLVMGLQVSYVPATNEINMSPGMLMQFSTTLVPTPGSLDSAFRVAFNRSEVQIPLPNPGAATWYLLEAQMVENTTLSQNRDVLDPSTGTFKPALVPKRKEFNITTQWKAGTTTNLPTPTGGDWIGIFGVLIQVGGTISFPTTHIRDMRTLPSMRAFGGTDYQSQRRPIVPFLASGSTPDNLLDNIIISVKEAWTNKSASGQYPAVQMRFGNPGGSSGANVSSILEPGQILTAETWYYVYFAGWFGLAPEDVGNSVEQRGVLVATTKQPAVTGGAFNIADITLPAPYSAFICPNDTIPCIGAIYYKDVGGGDVGWAPFQAVYGRFLHVSALNTIRRILLATDPGGASTRTITLLSSQFPVIGKRFKIKVSFGAMAPLANNENLNVGVRPVGGTGFWQQTVTAVPDRAVAGPIPSDIYIDIPRITTDWEVVVTVNAGTLGSISILLAEWEM